MLLVVLIVVTIAITALGVYVKFTMGRAPSDSDTIFSRFLRTGEGADPGEEAGAEVPELPGDMAAGSLPGIDLRPDAGGRPSGDLTIGSPAAAVAADGGPADKTGFLSGIGGGLTGLMGTRKSKDRIKEEVSIIDSQLEQVLQQSEEISLPGSMTIDMQSNTSLGLPDSMSLGLPDSMSLGLPDSMSLGLPDSMSLGAPDGMPGAGPATGLDDGLHSPESGGSTAVQKLCKEYVMPDAPPPLVEDGLPLDSPDLVPDKDGNGNSKKPKDAKGKQRGNPMQDQVGDFTGKTPDASDDLLKDLEAEAVKELEIDMSIMKEYRDMPLTCVELETDLKGILDKITVSAQGKR
jgi:hypothetical protein